MKQKNNVVWAPWDDFAVDTEISIPIEAPPCAGCIHFRPVRRFAMVDDAPVYEGVTLCHADGMCGDFSCFQSEPEKPKAKTKPKKPAAAAETEEPKQRRPRRTAAEMAAAGATSRAGKPAPVPVSARDDRQDPPELNTRPNFECEHKGTKCKGNNCACVCRPCIEVFNQENE